MSNEGSTSKLGFHANASNSPSLTPTSSSPVTINGVDPSSIHSNGNGIPPDGKLTSNHYQNGGLPDLQATFQGSAWSHVLEPLTGISGEHPFDVHNGARMFSSQTTTSSPAPLMAMLQQQQQQQQQQQMSYQQVNDEGEETLSIHRRLVAARSRQYKDDLLLLHTISPVKGCVMVFLPHPSRTHR